ncbi:MAG: hypothetical protein J6W35_06835 [Eubacterium sp.]|nr:hypothetical protein [Eubacterium sp.]
MQLTLCNFSKRLNSTKQPTAEQLQAGKTFTDVNLKQLVNIDSPDLVLAGAKQNDFAYNYAYIHDWGRYYHIKTCDLRHEDIYHAKLELDDLATFKAQILGTDAYIVYSSTGFNRWIKDDRCPIIIKNSEYVNSRSAITIGDHPVFTASDNEPVVITTISSNYGLYSWVTDENSIRGLMQELSDTDSWFNILSQQFGDAMGSIIQAIRLPINDQLLKDFSNQSQIALGKYITTRAECACYELATRHLHANGSIGIPVTYTDFRFTEPYCVAKLSIPFIGTVNFPLSQIAPSGGCDWDMDIDVLTGTIQFTFYDVTDGKTIASYSGKCGGLVPIAANQLSNISNAVTGISGGLLGAGLGFATGNPLTAGVGAIAGIASSFYGAQQSSSDVIGSYSGGRSEYQCRSLKLSVEKFSTANEPANLTDFEGRPVCKVDTIGNYSGYVKTQGFSIDIDANSDVVKSINSKLDAGIYIE